MHDFMFDHVHVDPNEAAARNDPQWAKDNIKLITVGIDIGSATSHVVFSREHLRRTAMGRSSRFVTVRRDILWQSPILLTPFRDGTHIDIDLLGRFIGGCYDEAGTEPDQIDSGAVILTGMALQRENARAIAELFADLSGKFVCAAAGHHHEAAMAAHGSGSVALSRTRETTLLNVDIGGGTTKFSLVRRGEILGCAAIAVGSRLIAEDAGHRLQRIEAPAQTVAQSLRFELARGAVLTPEQRSALVARMTDQIVAVIRGDALNDLGQKLLLTEPLPDWRRDPTLAPQALTFSGGVAEYIFEREHRRFNDLGHHLAHRLQHALADHRIALPVWDTGQGIRATATGAAQMTVQVSSGNLFVSHPERLPLRNLRVVPCRVGPPDPAAALHTALKQADIEDEAFALAFAWPSAAASQQLQMLARGIIELSRANASVVVLIDGVAATALGGILQAGLPQASIVVIDALQLGPFDYVDIGKLIAPANAITVSVKSLVF